MNVKTHLASSINTSMISILHVMYIFVSGVKELVEQLEACFIFMEITRNIKVFNCSLDGGFDDFVHINCSLPGGRRSGRTL